jgi:hypothetical protein
VATVAGIPSLITLLNALLAILALVSSTFPAPASLRGLMEQTYPDMTKNIDTARNPPWRKSRKKGNAKGKGTSNEVRGLLNPWKPCAITTRKQAIPRRPLSQLYWIGNVHRPIECRVLEGAWKSWFKVPLMG